MKDHSSISPAIQRFIRISILVDIIIVIILAGLALTGWIFDYPLLRNFGFSWNTMKPVTAITFLFSAIALIFLAEGKSKEYLKIVPRLCGLIMFISGLLTIISYAGVIITGKELSFTGMSFFKLFLKPGWRMSTLSGINFIVLGLIYTLLTSQNRRRIDIAHALLFIPATISYMILVSYILGIYNADYNSYIQVALNTGIAFCLVCTVLFYLQPESWIMKIFTGHNVGNQMARRLLPGIFLLPLVIAWLRIAGEESGFFSSNFGVTIEAITYTVLFIFLVWLIAWSVNRTDEALKNSEATLRLAQRASDAGTWDWDIPAGTIKWTPELFTVFGFDPDKDHANFDTWNQLLHPDDLDIANERIEKALREHKALDSTYRIIRPDGQIRWIRATGEGSYDEAGNAVRMLGICQDITQLWKTEESLIESEERYRSLFNTLIEGFCIIEVIFDDHEHPVDYRFLEINPVFEAQTGLKDAQGKSMKELVPQQEQYWYDTYGRIALTGIPEQFENEAKALGRWYEVSAYRVGKPEDRKVAILFNDITKRKLMENQIRSETRKALALSDLAKMFSESVFNITEVFDTIARKVSEYVGDICIITEMSKDGEWLIPVAFYHPDPAAGEVLHSVFPNLPLRVGEGNAGKVALTGQSVVVSGISEEQLKKVIKPEFWPYLDRFGIHDYLIVPIKTEGHVIGTMGVIRIESGHPFTTEDQSFIEVIAGRAGMVINNSRLYEALQQSHAELEKKVMERTAELDKTMNDLSIEQKRFRDVLDKLPSFVALMDQDYQFKFSNSAFTAQFGEPKGKRCYEHLYNRTKPCETCHNEELLKTNSYSFGEWKGSDGLTYDVSEIPFTDVDGSKMVLKIGSDITNIKQAEADRIAREVAESANRAKSEFLANISHEIRTPMNAIIGFSDLLNSTIKDEKQLSQVKAIQSSSKNLLTLINDILDLSKIEAGKMKIQPEPVNFHKLISELENVIIYMAQEKGIGFFIETEKNVPVTILIDEMRLRQVLSNLLDNAVKFTDEGHVILTIDWLHKTDEKIDLVISIEDTGIGIPEDQQEIIFQAFSRQNGLAEKKYGGTGLGLTITRRLVELMGGSINLSSEPGKGSIFTVILPDISIIYEAGMAKSEMIFDFRTIRFKKSRILIADDNFENRKLLIDLLSTSPLELIEAENGKEAVEIGKKYLPDLILMDLRMPEMSGYEAARILKSQESTMAIPIIALSASPKIVFNGQSYKDIFDDFIMKPVNIAELAEHLKKYLPYEVQASGQEEFDNQPVQKMTITQKLRVQELIEALENEYLPLYRKALAKQEISQINLFGQSLIKLGEKSGSGLVMDYGKDICLNAENFDVEHLMEKLRLFQEIIDRLKKTIKTT